MDNQLFEQTYNKLMDTLDMQDEWVPAKGTIPDGVVDNVAALADLFLERIRTDVPTVKAMIHSGMDPEEAWNKDMNLRVWLMQSLFAAYGMGIGSVEATSIPEAFKETISKLDLG